MANKKVSPEKQITALAIKRAVFNVVRYLMPEEQRHFMACDEKERKNHIYRSLVVLDEAWVKGAFNKPKAKKGEKACQK